MSGNRNREPWSFTKVIVWISKSIKDLAASPTITSGAAVPTAVEPDGSFYLRTNGAVYTSMTSVWTAITNNSTALASVASGEGASLVGVEDAATIYTAADAEGCLAEVMAKTNLSVPVAVVVADPGDAGAIPVDASADISVSTASGAGETNTMAVPAALGLTIHIAMDVDDGFDRVITVASPVNQAGNTVLTFADAGDSIVLMSVKKGAVFGWVILVNDGVALS